MAEPTPICTYAQAQALVSKVLRGRTNPELEAAAWAGLHRALERYDPARGPFAPFAAAVMRGHLLTQCRTWRNARHRLGCTADVAETTPAADATPRDPALARAVAAAVAALPPRQAEATRLVLAEGQTQEDAAALMGVTPQAVNGFITRARARLQCTLHEVQHEVMT